MSGSDSGVLRWLRLATGFLLSAAVAGYLVLVAVRGGFIQHPKRPHNLEALDRAQERYRILHQDPRQLFRRGTNPKRSVEKYLRKAYEKGMYRIQQRIEFHKALAYGNQPVPEGYSTDLQVFLSRDFPQFPPEYRVQLDAVKAMTVYYEPLTHYEVLGGGGPTSEVVFLSYLDKLVSLEWKVEELVYDPTGARGVISAERGNWHLTIGVLGQAVFPGRPVTVFWRMDRLSYNDATEFDDDDQEAYDFIEILDYSRYVWFD